MQELSPTGSADSAIAVLERFRMKLKTTLWDPTEFLDSPKSIAAYLEAAFEDGDPALIAAALGDIARAIGMTQMAAQAGVTREALYKALSPTGDPRLSTLLGVMRALGLKLTPRAA
jgi:probable addiction module antidote protein